MARVSIGLPVYNGSETILECLQCLQAQTFSDFEVVISDNGSTDGTSDICAAFCRVDSRFRHMRFEKTVPADINFTRARDLTEAPYFMWRADDDLADPDHLEGLVAALDRAPGAKLAVSPIFRIIETGARQEMLFELPQVPLGDKCARIASVLLGCHPSWFYGLWRREAVTQDWDRVTRDYCYLWASDHLAVLPAIFDEAVELVPGARFIQRIRRTATYRLPPDRLLAARRIYKTIALGLLDQRTLTVTERLRLEYTLHRHMEARVARHLRTIRRVIKERFAATFRLPLPTR